MSPSTDSRVMEQTRERGAPSLTSMSSAHVWPDNASMAHAETPIPVVVNETKVFFLWIIRRVVYC